MEITGAGLGSELVGNDSSNSECRETFIGIHALTIEQVKPTALGFTDVHAELHGISMSDCPKGTEHKD